MITDQIDSAIGQVFCDDITEMVMHNGLLYGYKVKEEEYEAF